MRPLRRVHRLDLLGDPLAHDIGATPEAVRVMGVQTLDPAARAADATPGPRLGQVAGPIFSRLLVRCVDRRPERLVVVRAFVEPRDPAVGFQPGDGLDRVGTGEPVRGGERRALGIEGRVPDHERMSAGAAGCDRERDGGLAAELLGDGCEICRTQFAVLDAGAARVRQSVDGLAAVSAASFVNILTTATAVLVVKVLTRTSSRMATLLVTA